MEAITLNGENKTIEKNKTVQELLKEKDQHRDGVAVAINDEIIPRSKWSEAVVQAGDKVEIIGAVQGG